MAHGPYIKPRAYLQCDCPFLLDQEDGNPAPGDLRQEFADLLDHFGREPLGRLIDQDQVPESTAALINKVRSPLTGEETVAKE